MTCGGPRVLDLNIRTLLTEGGKEGSKDRRMERKEEGFKEGRI
jgi:hypothetical protein